MSDENSKDVSYKRLIILFVIVIFIWLLAWHFIGSSFVSWQQRGTFGDMFGAINALFSGLAFAGVIFAILLQRKELELQRQELVDTRLELRGQKEALEKQNVSRDKQNFENTFFQLVRLQHEITESIDVKILENTYRGRDSFHELYRFYKGRVYQKLFYRLQSTDSIPQIIEKSYLVFYESYQSDLGHYFRNLYNIYKLINKSSFPYEERKFYSNLIRGQLSNYELLLLFYNAKSLLGRKFEEFIVEYELFDNLPLKEIADQDHISLYPNKAYGSQLANE